MLSTRTAFVSRFISDTVIAEWINSLRWTHDFVTGALSYSAQSEVIHQSRCRG